MQCQSIKLKDMVLKSSIKTGDVIGYGTRGQMARPFMYPALHDQEQAIAKKY